MVAVLFVSRSRSFAELLQLMMSFIVLKIVEIEHPSQTI
jgi:hypothetical protein